ncbi:MAG: glycosyltransferase family 2 protein [Candidatus Magasanikbacteria bacterium]|nr:glycosyltransferase family 2 protein [Candidatus Magasanikbacteria bacterium]
MIPDHIKYRIYEILPGLSIWLTLILGVVFSFFKPLWVIYFILIFDVYWVLRVSYFSIYLILSWLRFRKAVKINWLKMLDEKFLNWRTEKKNVIFLPVYNEDYEVLQTTLKAFLDSSLPAKELYIVVCGEERKKEHWEKLQEKLKQEFIGKFADLLFNTHPKNLMDEIPGKGSNIYHAEWNFKKYADAQGWDYKNIIVSVFDVDTVIHPEYFAHLTYLYCLHPRPERSSFQPVTLYNNNLWESPSVLRIMSFSTTFWMLFSLARLDNLVTFSSHSMSFQAIMDVGGHTKSIVSEDSRIFYQCWLHYKGDYEVTPLYIPVSMDTVRDRSVWKSLKNLYLQQRRWAWGTENIPYLLWQLKKVKEISRWKKFVIVFREWEGKWSWGVVAILITVLGRLPLYVAGGEVRQSALFFNTPHILEIMMALAMTGLLISAIMSMLVLPHKPEHESHFKYLTMVGQWILLPVSLLIFSSLPCLDAVTHLMFGKYLGFNVSQKKR